MAARIVDGSLISSFSGWHPRNPSRSAQLLAMTTASATGVPNVAAALLPRSKNVPLGACPIDWCLLLVDWLSRSLAAMKSISVIFLGHWLQDTDTQQRHGRKQEMPRSSFSKARIYLTICSHRASVQAWGPVHMPTTNKRPLYS